jgi:hypothetical protein
MSFAEDIAKFAAKCNGNADQVVRKIVLDIGSRVIERTPVGDPSYWQKPAPPGYVGGMARGAWSHSVGTLDKEVFDTIDASGSVSNARISSSVPVKAAGLVHFIQNSLPYIQALEDGHSPQCPPNGMVGLTVTEFQQVINQAIGELK